MSIRQQYSNNLMDFSVLFLYRSLLFARFLLNLFDARLASNAKTDWFNCIGMLLQFVTLSIWNC